jgi:thymidylate synthase ThyX
LKRVPRRCTVPHPGDQDVTPTPPPFHIETFSDAEHATLEPYFTNLDRPVFGIRNLPEVVKGALFARYSRSDKSIRRLFLDEFATDPELGINTIAGATIGGDRVGLERAEQLYDRVFTQYGDDSVAQLGAAHVAVEQASNILTKVLEWGRLASYLEQSTRYIFYDTRLGGRFRYVVPAEITGAGLADEYTATMDRLFETYSTVVGRLVEYYEGLHPRQDGDSAFVWRSTIRAKACDDARGLLPAATLSNVGVFASGQAYESLLLRMAAHPLEEVQWCGSEMLRELRTMIPSFMKRVDVPDRGGAWSAYLSENRQAMASLAAALPSDIGPAPAVTLVDYDRDGERKVAAAALYGASNLPETQIRGLVDSMSEPEIDEIFRAYVGSRANRRHKPGRAMEQTFYRFDVLCDYGIFRDLQRHRMLTIEWQDLSVDHGYITPQSVVDVGAASEWDMAMDDLARYHERLSSSTSNSVAQYAIPFAFNIRFAMNLNAREAFHMLELRTQQGGHPDYRRICQIMHDQIREVAGHHRIAEAMSFVDHEDYDLARIETERRAAAKRADLGIDDPSA